MGGLAAAVFLLVAQAPDLTAHMDHEGRVHCAGRIAAPDGARVKVWIFAGPVEDGRALDFRTVEIKSGAFDAPLKPANGERVPGRYTVVARLDPDRQPESVTLPETVRVSFDLRVGTSQDRRLFEETLGAEIEAALKQCQDLSARLGRDSKLDWAGELAALRDWLMRRDSIRILGWEPRLRRALEEIEAILKQKAEGGGGIDADRLDRALRQRCRWMLS
ncbi:MAG TPA: hypothetical protein VFC86_14710, partial [Planctomycetota bacterium]|nr:hypothetical protein [Planctomycetota bacterium]